MKVLLLTLVLGLVCADTSPTDLSQFSGQWKTLYKASDNPVMTSERGPFKGGLRGVVFDKANVHIYFIVLSKKNGKCVTQVYPGKRRKDNVFLMKAPRLTTYELTYASETSLVGYFTIEERKKKYSTVALMLGKSNHVDEQGSKKFKELIRKKNIPDANIVDGHKIEDCS